MEVSTMARKTQSPEEKERRAKIRELLQAANVSSMDDIQALFRDTIAEFIQIQQNLVLDGFGATAGVLGVSVLDHVRQIVGGAAEHEVICGGFGGHGDEIQRDTGGLLQCLEHGCVRGL